MQHAVHEDKYKAKRQQAGAKTRQHKGSPDEFEHCPVPFALCHLRCWLISALTRLGTGG
jgi:hypothetical protein